MPGNDIYCRVCSQALSSRLLDGHVDYIHPHGADHRPDPAPLREIDTPVLHCDFCYDTAVVAVYCCANQRTDFRQITAGVRKLGDYQRRHNAARLINVQTEATGFQSNWGDTWSACQPCGDLLDAGEVWQLVTRAMEGPKLSRITGKRMIRVRGELGDSYQHVVDTLIERVALDEFIGRGH